MHLSKTFIDKLFRYGILFVIALVLMDLLTYFYYPNTILSEIFLATREQTPLTWVSVTLFLLLGLSCALFYEKTGNRVWYMLSLIFLFFSMDDATFFHERLSGSIQNQVTFFKTFPSYSWVILYFPLLIFGMGGMLNMLWKKANQKEKKMLLGVVLMLSLAIFLDMLDGFVRKSESIVFCIDALCDKNVTHLIRLTEETLEVAGFGILTYLNLLEHCKK